MNVLRNLPEGEHLCRVEALSDSGATLGVTYTRLLVFRADPFAPLDQNGQCDFKYTIEPFTYLTCRVAGWCARVRSLVDGHVITEALCNFELRVSDTITFNEPSGLQP